MDFLNEISELLGNAVGWLVSWSDSPYAPLALFAVSLFDSGALFFPPEPLLIAMSTAQPNLAPLYAAIATAASVLGATIPYLVGRLGGRPLAERFVRGERIETAEAFFKAHGAPTTFIAAFAPLPYPVFALAAGVAHLGYPIFFLTSLAGRGARFFFDRAFDLLLRSGPPGLAGGLPGVGNPRPGRLVGTRLRPQQAVGQPV